MRTLIIKILLVIMCAFIFGSFQYGGIGTAAPFHNSWQSWFAGISLISSILMLFHEIFLKFWKVNFC